MEVKKNPNADLNKKSTFFFSIALLITMSLVLTAFEWKQYEAKIDELVTRRFDHFEMMDVPATELTPPAPPIRPTPVIVEVPDDQNMIDEITSINVEVPEGDPLPPVISPPVEPDPEPTDEIVLFPESHASFDGGLDAFYRYVSEKIKYPTQARRIETQGKVFVEFVINRDGSITDVKAIKRIGGGCDEEAERVIKSSPKWNPGKQRGKPVRQKMVLPVTFKLN